MQTRLDPYFLLWSLSVPPTRSGALGSTVQGTHAGTANRSLQQQLMLNAFKPQTAVRGLPPPTAYLLKRHGSVSERWALMPAASPPLCCTPKADSLPATPGCPAASGSWGALLSASRPRYRWQTPSSTHPGLWAEAGNGAQLLQLSLLPPGEVTAELERKPVHQDSNWHSDREVGALSSCLACYATMCTPERLSLKGMVFYLRT